MFSMAHCILNQHLLRIDIPMLSFTMEPWIWTTKVVTWTTKTAALCKRFYQLKICKKKFDYVLLFFFSTAGQEIINPIQSARIVTSKSFSFTYGYVEVRAKMPRGDWLWPGTYIWTIFLWDICKISNITLKLFGFYRRTAFTGRGLHRVR